MVSIIKNQLLKHLSRFTKNLSADKINLSTFKGEGELSNLELNEIVLTDLLELPSWLRLTKAWCNKVTFKIPWTKLKSVPIHLSLDEVNIIVETCEELRSMSAQGGLSSYAVPGKYSFIHKVIDGITVTVNTVNILFNSPAFTASVQISRIKVESKTPRWVRSDLRMTRLKDSEKGQLLIFKELEWQTVRIEAKSTIDKNLTPLRLLTNQARCRIVIKKRLSDCFIIGSRLVIILDDLLWVLTDSQLKAALHFLDSLSGLVQKATQITRKAKAARKLEELPEYQSQLAQDRQRQKQSIFANNDVVETSYHFLSNQIVLHLCDDPGPGRSSHPNLKDGGALQIMVKRFQVDFYPYHLAKGSRKHWPRYNETSVPHTLWQEQALGAFRSKFMDLFDANKMKHTPLSRKNGETNNKEMNDSQNTSPTSPPLNQKSVKKRLEQQLNKLMTTCVIMRIEDFTLYRVTTSGKKLQLKEFIAAQHKKRDRNLSGDRDHMQLPKESSIVHAEFIYYYYPSDIPFPLPPPKFYVQLNPIQIVFDVDSCLWLNSFGLNLYESLISKKKELSQANNLTYIDVKIEAILPRLSFESTVDHPNQKDRPKTLSFQVTRVTVTNVRSLEQSSRADLAKCVDSFHMGSLFFGTEFPSQPSDFYVVTQKFLDHISASDNIRNVPNDLNVSSLEEVLQVEQLSREFLWTEAKDVWCISLDPVWGDFLGAKAVGANKAVPFLDAIPLTLWLHSNLDPNSTIKMDNVIADIHALAHISNLVSIQLNHYQFLFLLRLAEEMSELMTFLSLDSNRILKVESNGSIAFGALIPQLEVTFVMPSQCPGKESSGGDVESFVPDSSSIADDMIVGSTATVWQNSTLSINQDHKVTIANNNQMEILPRTISMEFPQSPTSTTPNQSQQMLSSQKGQINFQNNFNAGFSSMKKGFTNLMSSLDSALKPSPDDMSDTVSIRSDASSDSENFVLLNMENDVVLSDLMFVVKEFTAMESASVEVASEVLEDEETMTTTSDHSFASSCRRKDLVSVSTFKLNKVELLQQSVGYSSSIKVQVGNVSCDDCSSIPWDEFQSKFSSRSRAWTDNPINSTTSPKIKLRLDHNLTLPSSKSMMELDFTDKENLRKLFRDVLIVSVNDLMLDLTMSTVTGLADLIEDEIIPIPIPMQITLDNVKLHLIEDRPPVNITSPGPIPIDLNITQLYITRSDDGVFNVFAFKPNTSSKTSINSEYEVSKVNKQLLSDVEELKRRLAAFERVSEENRSLRKAKEETGVLRSCLASAQDEVARLLEEKNKLLEELRMCKAILADRGRQWTTNKR